MKTRVACLLILAVAAPAAARAAGPPVSGLDGRVGVTSADGSDRFVAFVSGARTVVARLNTVGADISRSRTIRGRYVVPAVANDNTGGGLSHDGQTLVLVSPRKTMPQKTTSLAVLDATRLLVTKTINLRGDFSFDAISPDGSRVYLIQYLSLSRKNFDPLRYAVRSLDVTRGTLERAPIIDPREPDEKMGGLPVTRAMSADGRWAYTLYAGGEHPFIHALDTTGRTARCVDLDALTARDDLFDLRLRPSRDGAWVSVVDRTGTLLVRMDTKTFKVTSSPPAPQAGHRSAPSKDESGTALWPWFAAAGLVLALLGLGVSGRRRLTTQPR